MIKIMKLFALTMVVTLLLASALAQARNVHIPPHFPTEPIPPQRPHHGAEISVEQFPIPVPSVCPPGFPGCPPAKQYGACSIHHTLLQKVCVFLGGRVRAQQHLTYSRSCSKELKRRLNLWKSSSSLELMLFVAVSFPGTVAWTGAIIASILDMPFWSAVSSNVCGAVLAGLLVNLLVNLGLREAIVAGIALFFVYTFMWSVLRNIRKSVRPTLP